MGTATNRTLLQVFLEPIPALLLLIFDGWFNALVLIHWFSVSPPHVPLVWGLSALFTLGLISLQFFPRCAVRRVVRYLAIGSALPFLILDMVCSLFLMFWLPAFALIGVLALCLVISLIWLVLQIDASDDDAADAQPVPAYPGPQWAWVDGIPRPLPLEPRTGWDCEDTVPDESNWRPVHWPGLPGHFQSAPRHTQRLHLRRTVAADEWDLSTNQTWDEAGW